jgi:hypothetical protein
MTIFRQTHAGSRTCYAFDEHIPKDFCNEVKTTLFQVGDSLSRLSGRFNADFHVKLSRQKC